MLLAMTPIHHIRKNIFRSTQDEFALICQCDQSTVSRWEKKGSLVPTQTEMILIREAAKRRRMKWRDSWFFEAPKAA